MRHRERDYTNPTSFANSVVWGPRQADLAYSIWPSLESRYFPVGEISVIDDVIGDFEGENPVTHFMASYRHLGPRTISLDRITAPAGNVMVLQLNTCAPAYPSLDSFNTVHSPDHTLQERMSIPDYVAEAWYSCYPYIRNELNSINSIYELKDFKMLPSLFRKTTKAIDGINKSIDHVIAGATQSGVKPGVFKRLGYIFDHRLGVWVRSRALDIHVKTWTLAQFGSHFAKLGAEHFLNWKFAVQPFLDDINAAAKAASPVSDKIASLLSRADGSIQHVHYLRELPLQEIEGLAEVSYSEAQRQQEGAATHRVTNVMDVRPEYRAAFRYSFSFSEDARRLAYLLGTMDSFGVSPNPAILWRATRYSFIVDWFTKVAKALDRIAPHMLEPLVNIISGSHSIKYAYTTSVVCDPYDYNLTGPPLFILTGGGPKPLVTRSVNVYVRKQCAPTLLGIPKASDFSTMEKLLAGALLVSGNGRYGAY